MNTRWNTIAASAVSLALVGALSACGGTTTGGNETRSAAPAAVAAEPGALPATVKHKFGESTVKTAPKRVVSLGYNDQDTLLALGITPVAVRNWEGMTAPGKPAAQWALDKVSGPAPQIYDAKEVSPEAIAAMKPDLIIATYSGIDRNTYDALSKVAPVIAQGGQFSDYQQPWQDTVRQVGLAVGKPAEADRLIKGVDAKVEKLAAKHPEWKGRTLTVATFDGKELAAFSTKDGRSRFFNALGFTINPQVDAAAGDKFYASISLEETRLLNTDVLVWDQLSYAPKGKESITGTSAFTALPAMQDNRAIYLEGDLEKAFGWQTVLSIDYAIDKIEEPVTKALSK